MVSFATFFSLLVGFSTYASASQYGGNSKELCKVVDAGLPGRVSYPGTTGYNASQTVYYTSYERDLKPGCVFRPQSASEVSSFIKLVRSRDGDFAVRSGGHMLWEGAANTDGGITVDMRSLNSFSMSQDTKSIRIGGGTIFSELYPKLTPYNVTVSGARLPGIAAGGYLSGGKYKPSTRDPTQRLTVIVGGVGFFARSHGWSCDHVSGFEVVLSSGKIVEATAATNSDLWLALRGGSNNFGIITRFDIETIPMGTMWGGQVAFKYTQEALDAQAKAFSEYISPQNTDLKGGSLCTLLANLPRTRCIANCRYTLAMMAMIHVFQNPNKTYSLANALFHTGGIANPPVFAKFLATPGQVANQVASGSLADIVGAFGKTLPKSIDRYASSPQYPSTNATNSTSSFQLVFSFKHSDASIYTELWKIWKAGVAPIDDTTGLGIQFLIQPHPISNGTNSLGLDADATNIVMATVTAGYPNAADDAKVQPAISSLVGQMEKMLQGKGVYLPFKYLNYADVSQDAIGSYGKKVSEFRVRTRCEEVGTDCGYRSRRR